MGFGLLFVIPFALIICALLVLILRVVFKKFDGLYLILFGMELTIIAGFLSCSKNNILNGYEFIILLIGISFAIAGLSKGKKD